MITRLDEKVHRIDHDDWYAIVVQIPMHRGFPYRAFIYAPEDAICDTHLMRAKDLNDVELALIEFKQLSRIGIHV